MGPPGVGKGTQAGLIAERLGPCPLSTGDVLRAAKAASSCEGSPALAAALERMRQGLLVQDDVMLALVRERAGCLRCRGGFLLDGFPRTLAQARSLDALLQKQRVTLNAVVSYELPLEAIVERLSGRRVCAGCAAVYHVATRPSSDGAACERCGGGLAQREDDRPEAIRARMEAHARATIPLSEHYRRKGLLRPVSAEGSAEQVYSRGLRALGIVAAPGRG